MHCNNINTPQLCDHSFAASLAVANQSASANASPEQLTIVTSLTGLSLPSVLLFSTFLTTSIPLSTFPKTTCLPSNQEVCLVVMKNCEPFVSFPEFAMDNHPAP